MNQSPSIQLLAIDLDGTLLDSKKRVCPKAADSLIEAQKRGVKVVIASARPPRSVRMFYHCLGLDTWQINYNGAMIWDEPGRRVVEHTPIAGEKVLQLIRLAREKFPGVLVTCEILDRWHTDRFDQTHTTETGKLFKPDVVSPVEDFCNQPITKVMFLGKERMMLELETMLQRFSDISPVRTDPDLIQIMDRHVSKAAALKTVAAHYGVAMERVMAVGDAANDIPMLKAAGVGVAMDNAGPDVKAAADWVAPSNDDHGVHAALVRFGVI